MDAMIPASQVEQMIAEAVAKAVVPLQAALAQAKQTIAMLQTKIYGVRSEASKVVLTAEGQQFIELDLKGDDAAVARARVEAMCQKLLANTVIENYAVEIG